MSDRCNDRSENSSQAEFMKDRIKAAIHTEVQELKESGTPIAMYDEATGRPYMLYPDGRTEFLKNGCAV